MPPPDVRTWFRGKMPLLGVILMLLLLISFVFFAQEVYNNQQSVPITTPPKTIGEMIRLGTVSPPEFTEALAAKVAISTGFVAVVSYTDRGFEPSTLRIRSGETIRFTNNSSGAMWIASGGEGDVYPRTYDACGSSDLDSCEPLSPMDFWEFTFDVRGTWKITNNLDKSRTVTVIVE